MADDEGYYQIQATCRFGCGDHLPGEWRGSKTLPRSVTTDTEAVAFLDVYAATNWKSKPFRLVRVVPERVVPAVETVVKEIPQP